MTEFPTPAPVANPPPQLVATIHIGANAVSMLVAAPGEGGEELEPVDFLEQPVPLARDVFRAGRIGPAAMERCVRIVGSYRETLRELGVADAKPHRIVCTNILAEATNQEIFLNRLHVASGLEVDALDDGEQTRLVYMKAQRILSSDKALARGRTLVVHVGPGNTRLLLFKAGRIESYSSYRLGSHRSHEAVQASDPHGEAWLRMLAEQSQSVTDQILYDYGEAGAMEMVVIGHEMQSVAGRMFSGGAAALPLKVLRQFAQEIAGLSADERVRRLRLDYASADSVVAAAQINLRLAEGLGVKRVIVPRTSFEQGLLADLPYSLSLGARFESEVVQSAVKLGRRYQIDPRHARQVEELSLTLFEATADLHQLRSRDRLLLRVAAQLHEVGNYISVRSHHKHSYYIIHNSEIFGLSQSDIEVVALVARYHRHSPPKPTHEGYAELSRDRRMRVSKLAALLRVADALDRAHAQRARGLGMRVERGKFVISLPDVADPTIERLAMTDKGDLFRHLFGLEVVLESAIG